MNTNLRAALAAGIRLLFWSFLFFYRHPGLVLLSLIPASFRFIQMWNDHTPVWMEGIVAASRIALFFFVFARMSASTVQAVFQPELWKRWSDSLKIEWERNWPYTFMAQLFVYGVGLYGLMNIAIVQLLNPAVTAGFMAVFGGETFPYEQVFTASLFFLKNMTVIPLSIVYILRMLGVGIHDPELKRIGK